MIFHVRVYLSCTKQEGNIRGAMVSSTSRTDLSLFLDDTAPLLSSSGYGDMGSMKVYK